MAGAIKSSMRDSTTHRVADQMAQQVAEARARAGGLSSGNTMFIMARALSQVSNVVTARAQKKWVRVVLIVAGIALIVTGGMGAVIYVQHKQIARLLATKAAIDREIEATEMQMQQEQDPGRLQQLEAILATLTGSAEQTITQLRATNSVAAARAQAGGDELDQEIRRILTKFGAPTYDVPPIFRERLQFYINDITHSGNLQAIYRRKVRYWPVIVKEFTALGLPDEMAYVAWQESQFDPHAQNESGARGMWQMTTGTAQSLGLRVDDNVDERTDVTKQTHAAARYLANLLSEFGEDSFMLAMASYNRGEAGVRRVLHDVAQEPGGYRKANRDFWHLYRLKKLPEETREYVPRILAAAIIGNNPARYGLAAK
jgi:membrane-bound lytic murein transglycosylase D